MTIFLRVTDEEDKAEALRLAARGVRTIWLRQPSRLKVVPGSPFSYWVSDSITDIFNKFEPFETRRRIARRGSSTGDDSRRVRLWWEPISDGKWLSFAKGGAFSRFYSDIVLVASWCGRRRTYFDFTGRPGREIERPESVDHYFRAGLTWPRRTNGLSFRAMPKGCIFADKGPAAFIDTDNADDLLAICAIINSLPFGYFVSIQLARTELAQSYEVGLIQQTPYPKITTSDRLTLGRLAKIAWSATRALDTINETSHAFVLPAPLARRATEFDPAALRAKINHTRSLIDDLAFRLYDINSADRVAIELWGQRGAESNFVASEEQKENLSDEKDGNEEHIGDTETLLSWAVGVAFGRFDVRLATGERSIPPEPEPFDPLNAKSPGMVPDGDAPFRANEAVLVDDFSHRNDLVSLTGRILERVGIPQEGDYSPHAVRSWFSKNFFQMHIKMYSKSRRRAPIWWQLAVASAHYSVWLSYHALTRDTLFRVQNEAVVPKLAHEQRRLQALRIDAGANPTSAQAKAIESQENAVSEIQAMLEEIKRVAPLWNPNLDDGVIINAAPLWRLFPHHKPWQKECKATWDALCKGEYDWAHLAMHLWPERVVPKCAEDRSLAIAHGLEDVFWFEDEEGKWKPLDKPARPVADIIAERTSPAVKAALKSLIEATDTTAPVNRSRKAKMA